MEQKKTNPYAEARKSFKYRWERIKETVEYNHDWEVPIDPKYQKEAEAASCVTYDLKGMLDDPQFNTLPYGSLLRSMDDHGRKLIIMSTRLGLLVIHNVSVNSKKTQLLLTASSRLRFSYRCKIPRTKRDIWDLIGCHEYKLKSDGKIYRVRNLGQRIEDVFKMYNDPEYKPNPQEFYIEEVIRVN